ncbi:MAG: polysaccharide biosynthesis tyrosine autokinase [Bacillota bacterium]
MSNEIQLRPSEPLPDLADPLASCDRQGQQPQNIFKTIHRLLRNRYKWCIPLTLLAVGLGGYAGYKSSEPIYVSKGTVHIQPVISPTVRSTPETGVMPMFDSFVQAQATLISSQRVIEMAMQSNDWKSVGRWYPDDPLIAFMESLTVSAPRGEIITVSFKDRDSRVATAAVRAVLDAYNKIYIEGEQGQRGAKRQAIDDLASRLNRQLVATRDEIGTVTKGLGLDGLRNIRDMKVQNLNRVATTLDEIELSLAATDPKQPDGKQGQTGAIGQITAIEIAGKDPSMRQLLKEQQDLKTQLEIQRRSLGENHNRIRDLKVLLDAKSQQIEEYVAGFRVNASYGSIDPQKNLVGATPEQLRQRAAKYREMKAALENEINNLGRELDRAQKLQREEEQTAQDLEQVKRRIADLDIEAPQGRIRIISTGDHPTVLKDSRKQYAGVGGLGCGGMVFGFFLLIGLLDPRFRSPEDARSSAGHMALLGILPSLPEDLADPEQASIAAHCVHQIRTLLQLNTAKPGSRVFAITSPAAGTGKTSLALALGVSFAAANSRTLLIDCDIVGGGLTARVNTIIRRKIGQILKQQGLINQQQLDMAMRVARTSQRRLGEILVDLGYLSEADVQRALTIQEESPIGMLDALAGDQLENCIADTGIDGLSILPLGAAMPGDVSKLSPSLLRPLIERAREQYDTILIDTGPVPGSLEASVVATAADGVVMIVSRGEHRPLAEKSIQHLRDIGASIAGMVFNRAEVRDMEFSTTSNRLSSYDRGMRGTSVRRRNVVEGIVVDQPDPIALAMAGRRPEGKSENRPQS